MLAVLQQFSGINAILYYGPNIFQSAGLSNSDAGLRMGWLITQNEILMEQFLAAKEMIYISNSAIDEEVHFNFICRKRSLQKRSMKKQCKILNC